MQALSAEVRHSLSDPSCLSHTHQRRLLFPLLIGLTVGLGESGLVVLTHSDAVPFDTPNKICMQTR